LRFGVGSGEGLPLRRGRVLWKKRRERIRWRRVGFCGLAWEVNVKEVEDLALREGPEVIVLRVRVRNGVLIESECRKVDRMVVGSLAAPRAPSNVVRSILGFGEGRGLSRIWARKEISGRYKYKVFSWQTGLRPKKFPRSPSPRSTVF
jgi:hypothetical protein